MRGDHEPEIEPEINPEIEIFAGRVFYTMCTSKCLKISDLFRLML